VAVDWLSFRVRVTLVCLVYCHFNHFHARLEHHSQHGISSLHLISASHLYLSCAERSLQLPSRIGYKLQHPSFREGYSGQSEHRIRPPHLVNLRYAKPVPTCSNITTAGTEMLEYNTNIAVHKVPQDSFAFRNQGYHLATSASAQHDNTTLGKQTAPHPRTLAYPFRS
jgi:hypothetical protein